MKPKVSIIVTTLNNESTLDACLKSIKEQSYKRLELVVVDNYSKDDTKKISKKYTNKFYEKGPERSTQRRYAVEKSSGKYICIIDSDLVLDRNIIKECVDILETSQDTVGVVLTEESFGVGFWAKCKQLERSYYIGVPHIEAARFFKKADFIRIGGYNEKLISGEDWDLSQRMEELGKLGRTTNMVHHNEGKLSLIKIIRKKYYYATKFSQYMKDSNNKTNVSKQINILGRYRLYFSNPRKLLAHPVTFMGMVFMKTCEFGAGGIGLVASKFNRE